MFDLAHMNLVKWPITLTSQNGSTFEDVTLYVTYERLTKEELAEIQETDRKAYLTALQKLQRTVTSEKDESADVDAEVVTADQRRDKRLLARVKSWGDGIVSDGKSVPYSLEVARALFAVKPIFDAFYRGLIECSENARPKTLPPSPGGSVAAAQT